MKELCIKLGICKVYAMMHGQKNIKLDYPFLPSKLHKLI